MKKLRCGGCGWTVGSDEMFCGRCGVSTEHAIDEQSNMTPAERLADKRRRFFVVGWPIALTCCLLFAASIAFAEPDYMKPKGDSALVSLWAGAVHCAGVQHANPDAVDGPPMDYIKIAQTLAAFHEGENPETYDSSLTDSMYETMKTERAIKYQELRSNIGGRKYYMQYLVKTDAKNCPDIPRAANEILKHYGLRIE